MTRDLASFHFLTPSLSPPSPLLSLALSLSDRVLVCLLLGMSDIWILKGSFKLICKCDLHISHFCSCQAAPSPRLLSEAGAGAGSSDSDDDSHRGGGGGLVGGWRREMTEKAHMGLPFDVFQPWPNLNPCQTSLICILYICEIRERYKHPLVLAPFSPHRQV